MKAYTKERERVVPILRTNCLDSMSSFLRSSSVSQYTPLRTSVYPSEDQWLSQLSHKTCKVKMHRVSSKLFKHKIIIV